MKKAEFLTIYRECENTLKSDDCSSVIFNILKELLENQLVTKSFINSISGEDDELDEIIDMLSVDEYDIEELPW